MVSEGVDIPRLRVGVYATTVQSELFFRQAVGRFVRSLPNLEEQSAALFLPADAKLVRHALTIKEEREHHLRPVVEVEDDCFSKSAGDRQKAIDFSISMDGQPAINGGEVEKLSNQSGGVDFSSAESQLHETEQNNSHTFFQRSYIVPLSSKAKKHDTIFDGARFSPEELQEATTISQGLGINLPSPQVAALLRYQVESLQKISDSEALAQTDNKLKHLNQAKNQSVENLSSLKSDRKNALRKEINRMANRVAHKFNVEFDTVHRHWIQQNGGSSHRDATEEELRRKFQWLVMCFNNNSFTDAFVPSEK